MEPTATPPAAPAKQTVDLEQIKTMVDLPATASDVELITVLVNIIASLQEKYEGLLKDAVEMEDRLTNRDLADFADVIDEKALPFWKEQMLTNRAAAIEALTSLRSKVAQPEPPSRKRQPSPSPPPPPPRPSRSESPCGTAWRPSCARPLIAFPPSPPPPSGSIPWPRRSATAPTKSRS